MANVILIYPNTEHKSIRPVLGTLYLAAMLIKRGFKTILIDETVQPDAMEILRNSLGDDTLCVGMSVMTGRQITQGLATARAIRQMRPDLPIVWGGVHPTLEPADTLKSELVDAVCIGEAELSFPSLVEAYAHGFSREGICGIGFKEKNRLIFTDKPNEFFDLNNLPSLPYHLLDFSRYSLSEALNFFGFKGSRACSIEASRGCPFRCYYCVQTAKKERFRMMDRENIIRHMADIVGTGVSSIIFVDDNFFTRRTKAVEIMEAVREKKWDLEIFVAVRSDYLKRIDDREFGLMKEIGIKLLGVGVESGSDRMLEIMGKKEKIETTFEVNRILAKHRIHAYFHFISGFPEETIDDIIATYKAMIKIIMENPFARTTNKKLIPNPNTPVFDACVARGMRRPNTLEEWVEILDLTWRKKAPYIDPEVEQWFHSTQYFTEFLVFLSRLRAPYATRRQRILRMVVTPVFYIFAWIILLRAKFKYTGFFVDSFLSPLGLFCRGMVKKMGRKGSRRE